ncbi:ATPase, T2SS/T4P/T4SS family [Methylacidimicrobium sp. B4]|uniref:ATPase, T2SS/T4P/T4SS family n=1 Tax=Methylacidimicrobium sp. B4 TaxID=2796139 RepID=UPI001A909032|nr:ATPase, T2SS/T4P/T4SS family [Methylacidimicrobium sp. B4]QSR84011.1 Flp pilus assembly complex ATPase component TadA [Methylacidimicrobium sp. B4]
MNDLHKILASALANGATAVHLFGGEAPAARVNGKLGPLPFPPVSPEQANRWLQSLARRDDWSAAERVGSGRIPCYPGPGGILFRGRFSAGKPPAGMILFPLLPPPPFSPRAAPPPLRHLGALRGLVLLAGGIAAGKSTLLASLVAWLGNIECWHILALEEEPARFSYPPGRSWISRWETPRDFPDMARALGSPLARDADMVAIDPLRETPAIEAALDLAESGKLVLATHEAEGAADGVASLLRTLRQSETNTGAERVAAMLRLVLSPTVLPRLDGRGVAVLYETLPVHPAVAAAIRGGSLSTLKEFVQVGSEGGKHVDDALWDLCHSGIVGAQEAFGHARDKERFLARLDTGLAGGLVSKH